MKERLIVIKDSSDRLINGILVNILIGTLTILPIVVVGAIFTFLSNLISPKLQLLTRFVPHKEFTGYEPWWKALSIIVTLFILWLLGKYGQRVNKFLDRYLSGIPVLGKLYKIVNNIVESLRNLLGKKTVVGEPINIPFRNKFMPELGFIMSRNPSMWFVEGYGIVPCLPVSFATVPIAKGTNAVWIPVELIEKYEKGNSSNKFTFDEACQFNLSAGIDVPQRFIVKEEEPSEEKIA